MLSSMAGEPVKELHLHPQQIRGVKDITKLMTFGHIICTHNSKFLIPSCQYDFFVNKREGHNRSNVGRGDGLEGGLMVKV